MDRIIEFKGEIDIKELKPLEEKYIECFNELFREYYSKDQTNIKEQDFEYYLFQFVCFLTMPDEDSYEWVKDFIERKDFINYRKVHNILLNEQLKHSFNNFVDAKDLLSL